ncbi:hypothetical protein [Pontibaca methylaminivorans]|uniref:Uncharacterized protein n=1 Tax=Pontibaca methylaminivorans TaxID=515897 RepID=A0A1R3WYB0_9RHOB|nr:hypothetical protein [Pontibaca methylaminivorans]SIT81916.1 hypothetical protein SAMN05421849_1577 [Pontibaca methylaminivorans]
MITPHSARTKLACQIAAVDPDRFNEAVHAGNYPCAPQTARGSARVFDIEDMVALRVYSRLLNQEIPPRRAGHMACGIRDVLRQHPGANRVVEIILSMGSPYYLRAEDFDCDATHMSGLDIMEVREFRLDLIRECIVRDLHAEAGIIGEE